MKVLRKLNKKFNIIDKREYREIKYQNWLRRKLFFKIRPSFSLSREWVRRTSYKMLFLNQCLFKV
jgi:hypothetical protein